MKSPHFTLDGNELILVLEFEGLRKRVNQTIEYAWQKTGVDTSYVELLRQALPSQVQENHRFMKTQDRWILLPGLCCSALGGTPEGINEVTSAWYLFYTAAHIMDSLQDSDKPDSWWKDYGPGLALSCASGLFFTATKVLQDLYQYFSNTQKVKLIIDEFNFSMMTMCNGQYLDLKNEEKSLEQFWTITNQKSGSFFALACRSGARLASEEWIRINHLSEFGHQIGVIIQMLDELEDWYILSQCPEINDARKLIQSLPFFYTMDVIDKPKRETLKKKIRDFPKAQDTITELIGAIEGAGAAVYILSELERHKAIAKNALTKATALPPAMEKLCFLIDNIFDL
jgi:geranylgeranyl diphosphate synthase type I